MSDPYSDENHALGIANCSCYLCKHVMNGGELPSKGNNRKKFNKWLEQKGFCFYCLEPIPTWSDGVNEHIIPKSKGG